MVFVGQEVLDPKCACIFIQYHSSFIKSHCRLILLLFSKDGWAFNNNVDLKEHKNLEERLAAAQILAKEDPLCPVVVDDMTNTTASRYAALPERLYIIQSGNVIYKVRDS